MDAQQQDQDRQTGLGDVIACALGGLFFVFVGLPIIGGLIGIVAAVGAAVLGLAFAVLPFVVGLAVIAGIIALFSGDS